MPPPVERLIGVYSATMASLEIRPMEIPLTDAMIEALQNLSDGQQRHGAHVLPGRNGYQRATPLRLLRERGLIVRIRQPHPWSGPKDVEWLITNAGREAIKHPPKTE